MVNYQLGKIYKIVDLSTDECYIGSTCEPTLARRLAKHIGHLREYEAGKRRYITSFKILENRNYDIQLIEAYPCNNKMELHAREGYYIKNTECVNKVVPTRTDAEYSLDTREKRKLYRLNNKEKIRANKSRRYNCMCGGKYTHCNKSNHYRSNKHQQFDAKLENYILQNNPTLDDVINFIK
jgi:hypothetical protein